MWYFNRVHTFLLKEGYYSLRQMKLFFSFSKFVSHGFKKQFPFFCIGIEAVVHVHLGPELAPRAQEMVSWVWGWVDHLGKRCLCGSH